MTIGLPRSGKSTISKKLGYCIVNPDSIRLALHGKRFDIEYESEVWKITKIMVKSLFLAGHRVVILDATNTTNKRRDEWIDDKNRNYSILFIKVLTDKDTCIKRAMEDGYDDLIPIIEDMNKKLEWPKDNFIA